MFSQRFACLLNTFRLEGAAHFAATGNLTRGAEAAFGVSHIDGTTSQTQTVLRCHRGWLAVFGETPLNMILAGGNAAVLDA